MMVRPPSRIQHYTDQWASIADKARRVRVRPGAKPMPSTFSKGPGFTIAQVQRMAEDPMGTWFTAGLNAHIRALTTMFQCEILVNGSAYPFVTSDSPAVTHWQGEETPHSMPRGLGSRGCTITLPVSPRHALRFTHGTPGIVDPWPLLDWEGVFEINHLTITRARKVIVSDREDLFFVQAILDHLIKADTAAPDRTGFA
jgi:hypothetical protein